MPVQNGNVTFNIGRDCQVVIQGIRGRIDLPNVMGFDARQGVTAVKKLRLDGQMFNAKIPMDWTGSFMVERGSSALDDEIALAEAAWRQIGVLSSYTFYQYVAEAGGSTSTYQFDGVMLDFDSGSWKADATVEQKLMWTANTRKKV